MIEIKAKKRETNILSIPAPKMRLPRPTMIGKAHQNKKLYRRKPLTTLE